MFPELATADVRLNAGCADVEVIRLSFDALFPESVLGETRLEVLGPSVGDDLVVGGAGRLGSSLVQVAPTSLGPLGLPLPSLQWLVQASPRDLGNTVLQGFLPILLVQLRLG